MMKTINKVQRKSLVKKLGGETTISNIIDIFYDKILADYRVNRFFNNQNEDEQKAALKTFMIATCNSTKEADEGIKKLLDDFFMLAFARSKRKSFVAGSDFGFFGSLIEQDHPETHLLSDAHAYLLKFMPDDFHYDAVIEHLNASLQQLNISDELIKEALAITENARGCVLGRC